MHYDHYTLIDCHDGWETRRELGVYDSIAAAIAASDYPDPADWQLSVIDVILGRAVRERLGVEYSPLAIQAPGLLSRNALDGI